MDTSASATTTSIATSSMLEPKAAGLGASIRGMVADGLAATEAVDSSGEILSVSGCDISDYQAGVAVVNWEHKSGDGKGDTASDIVGKIVYAKKLLQRQDCETQRQRQYWDKVKLPCIYIIYRLYDAAGHQAAKDLAAQIRDHVANGEKVLVRLSIEGTTLEKEGNTLKTSVARRVAATIKPANRSCDTGLLLDPQAPPGFQELPEGSTAAEALERAGIAGPGDGGLDGPALKYEHPQYQRLAGAWEGEVVPFPAPSPRLQELTAAVAGAREMRKAIAAGSYNTAPSALVGGAALQVEDPALKRRWLINQTKAALREWDGRGRLQDYLKHQLPEASDDFLDRFAGMVDAYGIKDTLLMKKEKKPPKPPANRPKAEKPKAPKPEKLKLEPDTSFDPKALEGGVAEVNRTPPPKVAVWPKEMAQRFKKFRGSRPIPKTAGESYFDEATGVLHTHLGSFPIYIPDDPYYERILNSPEVQPHHDEAMRHWLNLHNLLAQGKLPESVAMHAAIFSGMSASAPVPMQEIAFSHLMDMLRLQGMDPSRPGGVQNRHREHFFDVLAPSEKPSAANNWQPAARNNVLPEDMREYWAGPQGDATRIQGSAMPLLGIPGQQKGLIHPSGKWEAVANYYRLHPNLIQLLQQHRDDAQAIATILKRQKYEGERHDSRKGVRVLGEPDYETATGLSKVAGFQTKTLRYLLGMVGGGNITVPDRHFVRHVFGIPQDEETAAQVKAEREAKHKPLQWDDNLHEEPVRIHGHLQEALWNSLNSAEIMNGIDRYYFTHHPAVKYVQNRFFGGQPDPQSLFPAFWAHWLSIAPHERALGLRSDAQNGGTDHRVYWNAVGRILQQHGLPYTEIRKGEGGVAGPYDGAPLAVRTAAAHRVMEQAFGPEPAAWFYLKHLLPMLLGAAPAHYERSRPPATPEQALAKAETEGCGKPTLDDGSPCRPGTLCERCIQRKRGRAKMGSFEGGGLTTPPRTGHLSIVKSRALEALTLELGQAVGELRLQKAERRQKKSAGTEVFNGTEVVPGEAVDKRGKRYTLLHQNSQHFVARSEAGKLLKLKRADQNLHYTVTRAPAAKTGPGIVSARAHGLPGYLRTPEQEQLVDGLDLSAHSLAPAGVQEGQGYSEWLRGPQGKLVLVKGGEGCDHEVEGAYGNVARDFFGLGQYLPTSASVRNPDYASGLGVWRRDPTLHVVGVIPGAMHLPWNSDIWGKMVMGLNDSGELDRMGIADMVLDNRDRHDKNIMLGEGGKRLWLIDHGQALGHNGEDGDGGSSETVWGEGLGPYTLHGELGYRLDNLETLRQQPIHPRAREWLAGLDEAKLDAMLKEHRIPDPVIVESTRRLRLLREAVAKNPNITREQALAAPWRPQQPPSKQERVAALALTQQHRQPPPGFRDGWNQVGRPGGSMKKAEALEKMAIANIRPGRKAEGSLGHGEGGLGPRPPAHEITTPTTTYEAGHQLREAGGGKGKNVYVKGAAGTDNSRRQLMVQFSSDLLQAPGHESDPSTAYYDHLYSGSRPGYSRPHDFWEVPQWQAHLAQSLPDADSYVVRDPVEAKSFLRGAGYGNVVFSALDANRNHIRDLARDYGGKVSVGGPTDLGFFSDLPTVHLHPTIQSLVEAEGKPYRPGYDYRHFSGTSTIPRLTLSDGCLHHCSFCTVPRGVEEKPEAEVLQQADAIAKYLRGGLVYVNDKTFGQAQNHRLLPQLYQRMKAQNPDFQGFVVQTTAAQMQKLEPEFLRQAGVRYVELGVESFNDPILKQAQKPANERLVQEAADRLRQAGIRLIPNIIVGMPGEDERSYGRTLGWLKRNRDIISHVNAYNLALYDNTSLGKKLRVMSDADRDENSLQGKSWLQDPALHERFAQSLYDFGHEQLQRQ